MLKQQFANVSVDPTAAGASGDVDGIFEPSHFREFRFPDGQRAPLDRIRFGDLLEAFLAVVGLQRRVRQRALRPQQSDSFGELPNGRVERRFAFGIQEVIRTSNHVLRHLSPRSIL